MANTMQAQVFLEAEKMEMRDVPIPRVGDADVLVKVKNCGICGSDISYFYMWSPPDKMPIILGHEFTGTIVALGSDCRRFKEGDRVVAEPHTRACGQCYLCRTGNIQICPEKRSPGWGIDGGMAEFICYPERLLHRIRAICSGVADLSRIEG